MSMYERIVQMCMWERGERGERERERERERASESIYLPWPLWCILSWAHRTKTEAKNGRTYHLNIESYKHIHVYCISVHKFSMEQLIYLLVRGEVNWPGEEGERKDPPIVRQKHTENVWVNSSPKICLHHPLPPTPQLDPPKNEHTS